MRLVDADALLSKMEKYSDDNARSKNEYLFGMQQQLETCIELVEDAPTVDAVPVVRCKDCKSFSHGYCRFHDAKFVRPDGYCYWGERKDGDGDG